MINELGVLARSGPVDAVQPNANVSVGMEVNQEAVPQIQKTPLGVRPEVHVWCTHSRSVGVDVRYLLWLVGAYDGATALVDEILRGAD